MLSWQGPLLNLLGSLMINGATNLMKLGVMMRATQTPWRGRWYGGALVFGIGNLLNFRSLSMAPQTILAALGAVQFISNVFFARFLLGEKITSRTLGATAAIVIGVVIAVYFIGRNEITTQYTALALAQRYKEMDYVFYLSVLAGVGVYLEYTHRRAPDAAALKPICFAAASAILGTQSVVQGKCASTVLSQSEELTAPALFFLGCSLVVLAGAQAFWLVRMQQGLALFAGSVIIPSLQVFWTLLSILTGGVYFEEFQALDIWDVVGFVAGLLVLLLGVLGLVGGGSSEALDPKLREHRATVFLGANQVDFLELAEDLLYDPTQPSGAGGAAEAGEIEMRRRTLRRSIYAAELPGA
ncbi:unnamed protein product [Effrenium voratum]|uniref:Magnesium transporter n=1 Tax=Effrenium voratum TaxID=2562239 RepID=A0AA36JS64_9DINO|nr:unnamed protein product [Effrenium voratum]CAJ1417906.1 unnamed protein product [Effrenium voratum]